MLQTFKWSASFAIVLESVDENQVLFYWPRCGKLMPAYIGQAGDDQSNNFICII